MSFRRGVPVPIVCGSIYPSLRSLSAGKGLSVSKDCTDLRSCSVIILTCPNYQKSRSHSDDGLTWTEQVLLGTPSDRCAPSALARFGISDSSRMGRPLADGKHEGPLFSGYPHFWMLQAAVDSIIRLNGTF